MRSKTTKKGIQILIGNGIYALAGLASAAIIIKKSSLEEYGTLVLLQAVFFTWSALTKPSTWQAVVKFSANHDLSIVANQSLSLETKTFWKTLAIIPLIAGMLNFLDYTEELTSIIIASTLWCSLIINNGTVIGVLRTKENYYNIALTQVLSSTQRIILALLLGQHVELYFLATTLIDALLWGYLIRMHVTKPFNKKSNNILCFDVKLFSSFSWWGTLHSALDLPVMHLDKILVMSLLGPAAAGALDLLKKVAQLPGQISAPANQIMLKKYSIFVQSKNIDGIRKTTITSVIALLLIYSFGGLVFYYASSRLTTPDWLNLTKQFSAELNAYLILQCIALSMTWVHPLLIALGKMRETSYAVALANTVYILTIAVAAPQIGLSAVILAFGIQSLSVIGIKIFIAYNEIKFGQSKS